MPPNSDSLLRFLEEIENSFEKEEVSKDQKDNIYRFPLNNMESVYLFDFTMNKIIFHQGFDTVFGYKINELTMSFIFDKYHPEDKPYIQSIVKSIVSQLMTITIPELSNVLNMSYRFQKADGQYANILSNTIIYKTNDEDRVEQVLIKYTDISFTSDSEAVEWKIDGTWLDENVINQQVYGDKMIFTERELEVIKKIFEGRLNNEISRELHISKHTVATHRKNIFLKSNCNDIKQLKVFCKKNGIEFKDKS
ncbi:MAG: helix-turn-helix transcriptional regulator [Flavobacteriaceae bacterium]|nr:MAG: helix-turn-helix transcriptional regulator [Flavobacteriaceae bacterium]